MNMENHTPLYSSAIADLEPTRPEDLDFLEISENDYSEYLPKLEKKLTPYSDTHNRLQMQEADLRASDEEPAAEENQWTMDASLTAQVAVQESSHPAEIIPGPILPEGGIKALETQISNLQIILMKKEAETLQVRQENEKLAQENTLLENALAKGKLDPGFVPSLTESLSEEDEPDLDEEATSFQPKLVVLHEFILNTDAKPSEVIFQETLA